MSVKFTGTELTVDRYCEFACESHRTLGVTGALLLPE